MVLIKKYIMLLELKNKYHLTFQDTISEKENSQLNLNLKQNRANKKNNKKVTKIHKDQQLQAQHTPISMIYIQSMAKVQVEQKFTMPMGLKLQQLLLIIHMGLMGHMDLMEEQKCTTQVENDLIIIC